MLRYLFLILAAIGIFYYFSDLSKSPEIGSAQTEPLLPVEQESKSKDKLQRLEPPHYTMSLEVIADSVEQAILPDSFEGSSSINKSVLDELIYTPIVVGSKKELINVDPVLRVTGQGEAWLSISKFLRLHFLYDSVNRFMTNEGLEDLIDGPVLQKIVLALQISRGGLIADKESNSEAIAIRTPNAVIVITGTQFFVVYDPDVDTTWVGKFKGNLTVYSTNGGDPITLGDQRMVVMSGKQKPKEWDLHSDHMVPAEFERLIRQKTSPIEAVDIISGSYLITQWQQNLHVHNAPALNSARIGSIPYGTYSRILDRRGAWWKIECPKNIKGNSCWVSSGDEYTKAYNIEKLGSPPKLGTLPNTGKALDFDFYVNWSDTSNAGESTATVTINAVGGRGNYTYYMDEAFKQQGSSFTFQWRTCSGMVTKSFQVEDSTGHRVSKPYAEKAPCPNSGQPNSQPQASQPSAQIIAWDIPIKKEKYSDNFFVCDDYDMIVTANVLAADKVFLEFGNGSRAEMQNTGNSTFLITVAKNQIPDDSTLSWNIIAIDKHGREVRGATKSYPTDGCQPLL
ncbi:MAG: SH3 domain-containing protein [Anaerolineales bacterium]|nr:SH3 domain-containing protein [Anaerolineales bacterium]